MAGRHCVVAVKGQARASRSGPGPVGGWGGHVGGVSGPPVGLQELGQVLTGVVQLVLIQDHIKHFLKIMTVVLL